MRSIRFTGLILLGFLANSLAEDSRSEDPNTGSAAADRLPLILGVPARIAEPDMENRGSSAEDLPAIRPYRIKTSNYDAIYESISFRRSLHKANPMYRHEATMALITRVPSPESLAAVEASMTEAVHPPLRSWARDESRVRIGLFPESPEAGQRIFRR